MLNVPEAARRSRVLDRKVTTVGEDCKAWTLPATVAVSQSLPIYFSFGFLDLCYCSRRCCSCQRFLFYIIFSLFLSVCLSVCLTVSSSFTNISVDSALITPVLLPYRDYVTLAIISYQLFRNCRQFFFALKKLLILWIILFSLRNYHSTSNTLQHSLFHSYLTNRTQCVFHSNE